MTYDEIYRQISGVDYSEAISHYNQLKERFFKELSITTGYSKESVYEQFVENIIDDFNNKEKTILEDHKESNRLYADIENSILQAFQGDKKNLRTIRKQLQDKYGEEFKSDNKALLQEAEQLFTDEEIEKVIWEHLYVAYGITRGTGVDISDISNRMKSFRSRIFSQRIVQNKSSRTAYARASSSTKGYFREAMIHQGFYEFFYQLDKRLPDYALLHAGGRHVEGAQPEMDEYINFLGALQNFEGQVKHEVSSGYGIQSKSYIEPWKRNMEFIDTTKANLIFGVGSRSDLLSGLIASGNSGWIANVQYLGAKERTLAALGDHNAFYSTGSGFYFTADLISQFRANNYFLSFVYKSSENGYVPSSHITWQQIDMSRS